MSERGWAGLIFGLYTFLGLGYSLLMPMWEGPDEHAHYHLAWSIAHKGKLPSINMNYEAYQPPMYYWLASRPLIWMEKIDPSLTEFVLPKERYFRYIGQPVRIFNWTDKNYRFLWGPQVLRWLNLCLGGFALLLIFRGAHRFVPEVPNVALVTTALAGLLPQFLHIVSTVSNDALTILAGAFLFWLFSLANRQGLHGWQVIMSIAAALVLPVATKLTVLPISLAVFLAIGWQWRQAWRPYWKWTLAGVFLTSAGFVIGIFWLAPTRADILLSELQWRGLSLHPDALKSSYFWPMFIQVVWSFWGKVGWLSVGLPGGVVIALSVLAILGGCGNLWMLLGNRSQKYKTGKSDWVISPLAWGLVWSAILFALSMVLKNGLTTPRNQGRFLFPSGGVLMLVISSGWYYLASPLLKAYILPLTVMTLTALNLLLWYQGVIPIYYQPFLD